MPNNALSDKELVGQVVNGRTDLFGQLVERHIHGAYAIAYARVGNVADAEDAVQEAFLRALEKLRSLRDPAKFGSWLLSIARNEAVRLHTQRARSAGDAPAATPAITPDVSSREMNALVREQVVRLPEQHREILLLHYFTGRSTNEIAELLNLRRGAVLKRLQRAREQLAEALLPDLEGARPSDASVAKQAARIVTLASTVSVGGVVTGTATVSAAASLLLPKAATVAAGLIGAAVTLAGIAGFVRHAHNEPTYAQRDPAPAEQINESESRRILPTALTPESQASPHPARPEATQPGQKTPQTAATSVELPSPTGVDPGHVDLNAKVTIAFENIHLAEILLFLAEEMHVGFLIDRRAIGVPEKGTTEATPPAMRPYPVSGKIAKIRVNNQPLGAALDGILAEAGLKAVLAPGYLWISTPAQIQRDARSYSRARYANYSTSMSTVLETPVNLQFDNVYVSEVIEFVNEIYKINIAIDSRVVAPPKGPLETRVFTSPECTDGKIQYVNLKDIRLDDALQVITRTTNLTFSVRKDYLWLTSEQMLRRDGIVPLPPEARPERMDKLVASPITIAFEKVNITEILSFINEIYDVNIPIDQRVATWKDEPSAGIPVADVQDQTAAVSHGMIKYINVKNISLSSALDVLTRDLDLAYTIRGNDVIVSNAKRLAAPGPDAADLIPVKTFENLTKEALITRKTAPAKAGNLYITPDGAQAAPPRAPSLIEIRKVSTGYQAEIDTGQRPDWFNEGESFGNYKLLRIDVDAGCAELFDEASAKTVTICGVTSGRR